MALDGDFEADGTLKGEQGGIVGLEPFTAERAKDKAAADPNALGETLTKVKNPQEPFRFSGVDQSGKTLDQSSPEFAGKPLIVDIFGTWCPNCHDEAPVLEKLYQKYHEQGCRLLGSLTSTPTTSSAVCSRSESIARSLGSRFRCC